MIRILFWVFTACIVAAGSHVATLLFAPRVTLERSLASASDVGVNHFALLTRDAQAKLLPDYPADTLFGICRFDLRKGPVTLTANMPDSLWVLAVYSSSGKTLYTVNDRQSGVNNFELKLVKAQGILDMFTTKADDDSDVILDQGWLVSSPETEGLALLWVPMADQAQRASLAATLAKSDCRSS